MLSHDRLYSAQPEPGPLTNGFGREKRVEDVRLNLRGYTRAAITDFNHRVLILAKGSKPKFPLTEHGFDRVLYEVGPHLIQLSSGRVDEKRDGLESAHQVDSRSQNVGQGAKGGFETYDYVDVLNRSLIHIGVLLYGLDQI